MSKELQTRSPLILSLGTVGVSGLMGDHNFVKRFFPVFNSSQTKYSPVWPTNVC